MITPLSTASDRPVASCLLHHVGIVARDDAQIAEFAAGLGLHEVRREYLAAHRVTNVFLSGGPGAAVQFMLPDGGVLANYNRGRGGLHHLAFTAPDVEAMQQGLAARGLRFITPTLQPGIGRFRFNFVLPSLAGINVEIIEDPDVEWP